VAVNTTDVATEQHLRLFTRAFGRRALLAHAALILPPWILFLRSLGGLPAGQLKTGEVAARRWGGLLTAAGIALSVTGFKELGLGGLVNQDQFAAAPRRSTSGIYRVFRDPIYVGYTLAMAGWAIRRRSLAGLALALEMLLLLTQVEARIEARPLSRRPL
jgi:protein-S-isoprenylcysteine O-methyltransferase Ste14